ncbi:hypothetical protein MUG10_13820 [Xanthomonas prunicola]|uniref:Uncharacterized protein n=1 Tax=Xanthomonas prunicola TaxID=2053930 RepID=A0A9Q9MQE2_9XANT|nr:hypothetical protein [Xanthomonas prunicola]USI99175.1 hypothetical protein MUG10_13820 [Xanthomonas prunicola]UXA47596.1 hypothetical protein M0D44_14675 [Xanthomonas prunicola]UXA56058.1 hypothetical protein M0D47_14615 [Xanthomonas prunicola]UXA62033.1 hypothetical protein M0D48_03115 [Xanthomonas prunicola]UXA64228.1 hypothetical protein M0D43_14780 [Xanthomonas prunicola]
MDHDPVKNERDRASNANEYALITPTAQPATHAHRQPVAAGPSAAVSPTARRTALRNGLKTARMRTDKTFD